MAADSAFAWTSVAEASLEMSRTVVKEELLRQKMEAAQRQIHEIVDKTSGLVAKDLDILKCCAAEIREMYGQLLQLGVFRAATLEKFKATVLAELYREYSKQCLRTDTMGVIKAAQDAATSADVAVWGAAQAMTAAQTKGGDTV